jgi:hypothetical protein
MTKTRKQTIYNDQNEETDNLQWPKRRKKTIYNGQNKETDNLQRPKRGNRQSTMTKTKKQTIYNGQNEETDNLQRPKRGNRQSTMAKTSTKNGRQNTTQKIILCNTNPTKKPRVNSSPLEG